MKNIFIFSFLFSFSAFLFAQDIILTTENEIIKAKILTQYDAVIKYALYEDQEGATQLILKSKIISITYENGEVEGFGSPDNPNSVMGNKTAILDPNDPIRKNIVRILPLTTIMGAISGIFEIELQYARYFTPNVAIPIDIDFGYVSEVGAAFALMSGIEAVPITHRQKSGLFLNALGGIIVFENVIGGVANANIGYQLVTKGGFHFNFGIGPMYNSLGEKKLTFHITLGIGIAF